MNSYTKHEIVKKTIDQMPDKFTSREFNRQVIQNGYPKEILRKKGLGNFIQYYAKNDFPHSKRWTKRSACDNFFDNAMETENDNDPKHNIDEMIEILKNQGFKIYKPQTTYEEI